MNCVNCGADLPEQGSLCPGCGQPILRVAIPSSPRLASPPVPEPEAGMEVGVEAQPQAPEREEVPSRPVHKVIYAGFWLRLLAYLIDSVILAFPAAFLLAYLTPALGMRTPPPLVPRNPAALRQLYLLDAVLLGVAWLYFAVLESSPWQATFGKRILGLVVTDLEGKRISFARASMRFFGKLISSMTLLIGYIIAGFTERKQALHDILASCLVIRKA